MLLLVAIALGAAVVVYAVWRAPSAIGWLHAAAGIVVYGLAGFVWVIAVSVAPGLIEPMIAPWRAMHLERLFVVLLYFAPPLVAALLTVRVLGRDRMSR